jgi:hypothetical protein
LPPQIIAPWPIVELSTLSCQVIRPASDTPLPPLSMANGSESARTTVFVSDLSRQIDAQQVR